MIIKTAITLFAAGLGLMYAFLMVGSWAVRRIEARKEQESAEREEER